MNITVMMNACRGWVSMLHARMMVFLSPMENTEPQLDEEPTSRERIITELLALQSKDRAESEDRQRRIEALSDTLREVETRADTLRQEIAREHTQQMVQSLQVGAQLDALRTELASCCPAQVVVLLSRVSTKIDHLQRNHNMETRAIHRLAVLRAAREEAEGLRIAPIAMAEVLTQLRRIECTLRTTAHGSFHDLVTVR